MPREVYEEKVFFDQSKCDAYNNATVSNLARFMEAATRDHVEELGIDTIKLVERGTLWVICWSQIDITRMPRAGESVILKSWEGPIKYGLLTRRFRFLDESGEMLANIASTFTIIDKETRSQTDIPEDIMALPVVKFDDDMPIPKLSMDFPKELKSTSFHQVNDSEIDVNGHVNNSFYFEWAMDVLDEDFKKNHSLKSIWIEYSHEIRPGDKVKLCYSLEDDILFFEGYVESEKAYSVKMEF